MAILDKAEHVQAELTKAEGMSRAVAMACGLVELQEAMSDDVVSVLMSLQGNPMGFRSDKIYPPEVVKACAISALLSGAYLVDDEWQIIAGQCYLGQKYFLRKIREYPGVTDVEITIDLPEALTPTLLVCGGYARCRKGGKRVEVFARKSDKFGDSRIAVTAHKGDIDQAQGKAKKRLAQRLYERIAGVTITDEDPVLESIDVLTVEPPAAPPSAPPATVNWKDELYIHGGPESYTVKCGRRIHEAAKGANPIASIAAHLEEARGMIGGTIEQRAYNTLERYAASFDLDHVA